MNLGYGAEQPLSEAGLRICRVVSEQPGIHFRGLARAATLPAGQLRHHLDRLVRRGILVELEDGGYKRFFLAGKHDPHLRPALALFARRVPRRIGSLLLLRPMTRTELRRHLGCGDSTLGFHLARMVQARVVTKQRDRSGCRYALAEPELARQALAMRAAAASQEERLQAQREAAQARDGWSPLGAPRDGLLPPRREPAPLSAPAQPAMDGPPLPTHGLQDTVRAEPIAGPELPDAPPAEPAEPGAPPEPEAKPRPEIAAPEPL
jgi:DNA-binding transcriptional ArsR family regulator